MSELADKAFGSDERFKSKFIDIGNRIVKTGSVKQSIDWVPQHDVEMLANVLSELDFV